MMLDILKFSTVVVVFLLLICDATVQGEKEWTEEKAPFTLEEFLTGAFAASSWNGTWINDTSFLYQTESEDYYIFDVVSRRSDFFLNPDFLEDYEGGSVSFSLDLTYALIRYNVSSIFRYSTASSYAIFDIANKTAYDINGKSPVQLAKFDTTGHGVVYILDNNIYYVPNIQQSSKPIQVTDDGEAGVVYNGVPDWVYEEEVIGGSSALWFSPDGKRLAYAQFNDTLVEDFYYFVYGEPGAIEDQYPKLITIKYPKVGTNNPLVRTFVYDIETGETTQFKLVDAIRASEDDNDYIFYNLKWVSNSEVAMISTNRVQNESIIIRCTLNGDCNEEISYRQENGWLNPALPIYNVNGTVRLEILPQPVEEDHFNHLVLTDIVSKAAKRLTFGAREVTTIYGWNQENNLIYFGSSVNNTPAQQHVYVVNAETLEESCLSCGLTVDSEPCTYASAVFNKITTHLVDICQGPSIAYAVIQSTSNQSEMYVWNANEEVRERLAKKLRPAHLNLAVPLPGNFTAKVRLHLPPNFDDSKKYPTLVYVYGGPDSNLILDYFDNGITNYLVTNRSYIVALIEGRGCGRQGHNKMFEIYRKFGTVEIEDQIEVTKYLQDTYPFIDKTKTGIWGWSYGGFASSWALARDTQNVFKFAFAVAPVTSFIYYDSIYTERYMGLPTEEDNLAGYNDTDLSRQPEAFRDKLYCVTHGNADDNVHYQNTMSLIKALELADVPFYLQSYPDENHGLGDVKPHFYHSMDKFLARAFGIERPPL